MCSSIMHTLIPLLLHIPIPLLHHVPVPILLHIPIPLLIHIPTPKEWVSSDWLQTRDTLHITNPFTISTYADASWTSDPSYTPQPDNTCNRKVTSYIIGASLNEPHIDELNVCNPYIITMVHTAPVCRYRVRDIFQLDLEAT